MGTGLVAGTSIGEVSPALLQAVATSRAPVTESSRRRARGVWRETARNLTTTHTVDGAQRYWFCGKPSSMPPWLGSSQRLVMAFCRVKNCTPSMPWAWLSPNSDAFQPPKL